YLARPQQTGLVDHSTGGLHDQSEGEKRLKAIPLLLTTNFPLLKTTRHFPVSLLPCARDFCYN
ncbi:MAG: hypothetical protein IJ173_05165, partial [Kiritimatiellae bacterium]|nr:hypothetical protein [Kiritimatiellia bacterium]